MRIPYRSLSAAAFAVATALSAQQVVLHNATVIDGTGAPARKAMDVILRDGLIAAVTPAVRRATPQDDQLRNGQIIVDCTGKPSSPD